MILAMRTHGAQMALLYIVDHDHVCFTSGSSEIGIVML